MVRVVGTPYADYRRQTRVLLVAATFASLVITVAAGYLTRLSLVEAAWWVTHTDEVKLALAGCQRALDHGDDGALRKEEDEVERLTVDNARQKENIRQARLLRQEGARDALDRLLTAMQTEEDRLQVERSARIASAKARSSLAFVAGAVLTMSDWATDPGLDLESGAAGPSKRAIDSPSGPPWVSPT
jgi:hypothetical protein